MSLWLQGRELLWPAARLKDHVDLINGFPFDSSRFNDSVGTPVIRIRDLMRGRTGTYYDGEVPGAVIVRTGDLLVGMDGDFNSITWTGGAAALNQRLCLIRGRHTMDQRYLGYLIPLPLRAINDVTYRTTVKHLSSVDLLNQRVPLPTLAEQRAIADFLEAETARIDALVAKKRRLIEVIGERRMSLMTAGVSGHLTLSGQHNPSSMPWLDSIPEHWGEVGLTLLARLGSGHTPSRSRNDWWIESECTIPWITTGEVARLRSDRVEHIENTRERISPIGLENSAAEVHPAGTVVLCRTASAGYSGIMRGDMATSQDFATWTCGPLLRPRFLLLCLRAMREDLLGRLAMGSTHKTIYMPDIQSIRIPLPLVEEQDEIVEAVWLELDRDGHIADLLTRQIDLLGERCQALITAAVTGDLDVAESIAEVAS